jgi:hypothetical protein
MSLLKQRKLVGKLTKHEVQKCVPPGIFTHDLRRKHWDLVLASIERLPEDIRRLIRIAASKKQARKARKGKMSLARSKIRRAKEGRRLDDVSVDQRNLRNVADEELGNDDVHIAVHETEDQNVSVDYVRFMKLPTEMERRACFREFRDATSNEALLQSVCVVCAREMWNYEGV